MFKTLRWQVRGQRLQLLVVEIARRRHHRTRDIGRGILEVSYQPRVTAIAPAFVAQLGTDLAALTVDPVAANAVLLLKDEFALVRPVRSVFGRDRFGSGLLKLTHCDNHLPGAGFIEHRAPGRHSRETDAILN